MLGMPQGFEWVIIAIVVLVLFGGTKLASLGKNAGKAIREFKEETSAGKPGAVEPPATPSDPAKPAESAKPTDAPSDNA